MCGKLALIGVAKTVLLCAAVFFYSISAKNAGYVQPPNPLSPALVRYVIIYILLKDLYYRSFESSILKEKNLSTLNFSHGTCHDRRL